MGLCGNCGEKCRSWRTILKDSKNTPKLQIIQCFTNFLYPKNTFLKNRKVFFFFYTL